MSLAILSTATALPDTAVSLTEAFEVARQACCSTYEQDTWLPMIYENIGVRTRYMSFGRELMQDIINHTRFSGSPFLTTGDPRDRGPKTSVRMEHYARLAPPLAVEAARGALSRSELPARSLTHLVTVSCTGFQAPGVDLALIRQLDLAPTVQRVHIGFMGCHGAINGLRVADALAGAHPQARVLLCAVELCSLHYWYTWDPQRVIANALFADGAAAVVGVGSSSAPPDAWRVAATGSCLIPDSAEAMTWSIGDHGFEMTLSREIPVLIQKHLRPWLEGWLEEQGVPRREVGSWAIHPGGPRILDAVAEQMQLSEADMACSRGVLADCGNMSSPTVLFVLERLRRARAALPCVALGFGPGMVAEVALFR